jgi:hypothetical protein
MEAAMVVLSCIMIMIIAVGFMEAYEILTVKNI